MAICFNNAKCKAKASCKKRCKSFFPSQKTLRQGCESLCKTGITGFTKDDYLCSGKYASEAAVMLEFGYDPCFGGQTLEEVLDPTDTAGQAEENFKRLTPVFVALGALILIALFILLKK